jgi:DNA polymerase I-like protein with 3'-5' exonuclease and polymerase domains
MLVSRQNVLDVIQKISRESFVGLDSETTGTGADDSIFSLIISTNEDTYYFNFQAYDDVKFGDTFYPAILPEFILNKAHTFAVLNEQVFFNPLRTYFIHNAKFDWRMLSKEGVTLEGTVHCSYAIERVIRNNYGPKAYNLAACAARRGLEKDEAVAEFISKHKLYTKVNVPGKKKIVEHPHFEKVPWQIMTAYGEKDGHLHLTIGLDQVKTISEMERSIPVLDGKPIHPSYMPVYNNEIRLTRTLAAMERKGILIDKPFTARALEYELDQVRIAESEFQQLTGEKFEDSRALFKKVFDAVGEKYPTTDKGNPSFAADVLEAMTTPIAACVNKIRHHDKRAGTYYSSFLYFADKNNIIHASANQAGTEPGRMSYSDPNLQNVPKEDDEEDQATPYHVRSCFIPRPGRFFYDIDYQQMEYRLMLDYAEQMDVIDLVMAGQDLHQAMADLVGITRKQAKTLNFAILYGAGAGKVAMMLGITLSEAKALINRYFSRLPKIEKFKNDVIKAGKARGYVFNWAGRRCHISHPEFAYIMPNHHIQGGCADVVKIAMNRIDDFFNEKKIRSDMLLQVHDELLFEFEPLEAEIIQDVQKIMESVYKSSTGIILTTSVAHSKTGWGYRDLTEGYYNG